MLSTVSSDGYNSASVLGYLGTLCWVACQRHKWNYDSAVGGPEQSGILGSHLAVLTPVSYVALCK